MTAQNPAFLSNPFANLDDEQTRSLYDFISNLAIVGGIDWNRLTDDQKTLVSARILTILSNYLTEYFEQNSNEEDRKHLRMILASGMNQKLVEKFPNVGELISKALKDLVEEVVKA